MLEPHCTVPIYDSRGRGQVKRYVRKFSKMVNPYLMNLLKEM